MIMLMLLCMAGYASEAYVVKTKSLVMRAKPKSSAKKLGSLKQDEVIRVDTIINGWATCTNEAGETFYVASEHLMKKEEAQAVVKQEKDKKYGVPPTEVIQQRVRRVLSYLGFHVNPKPLNGVFSFAFYWPIIVLGFISILHFILKFFVEKSTEESVTMFFLFIGMAFMCLLEMMCIISHKGDPAWFCDIDSSIFTIIFWLVLLFILAGFQAFMLHAFNSKAYGADFDLNLIDQTGPLSTYICAALYLLFYLFFTFLQPYVVGLFLLCQVIHIILMFIDSRDKSIWGLFKFGVNTLIYLLMAVSTFLLIIMVVAHLFYLLSNVSFWWYVGIVVILLAGLGSGGSYIGTFYGRDGTRIDVYK